MRLLPFIPPKSHLAPGDLCRIRNHTHVLPRYRGGYVTVLSTLMRRPRRKPHLSRWAHQVESRRGRPGVALYISPDYLVKIEPPGREKGSWRECPFNPATRGIPIPHDVMRALPPGGAPAR